MNNELKPCPFCGGRAILEHTDLHLNGHNSHESIKGLYSSTWQVSCFNCGIRKSSHTSYYKFTNQGTLELPKNEIDGRAEAIKSWNRRVSENDRNICK